MFENSLILSQIGLWIVVVVLYIAVFMLYRYLGEQVNARQSEEKNFGPKLDEAASATLVAVDSTEHSLDDGRARVILFAAPRCSHCARIQPIVKEAAAKSKAVETIVAYMGESSPAAKYAEAVSGIAVSDPKNEFGKIWNVAVTPFFVAVDSEGVVRKKGVGATLEAVESYYAAVTPIKKTQSEMRQKFARA